jgi:hypothetical protein
VETEAVYQTKSQAKRNLHWGIFSWGVLAVIAIIGFVMERYYATGDSYTFIPVLCVIVVVLFGNTLLFLREFIVGIKIIRNKTQEIDPVTMKTAWISTLLGLIGVVISVGLFLGW